MKLAPGLCRKSIGSSKRLLWKIFSTLFKIWQINETKNITVIIVCNIFLYVHYLSVALEKKNNKKKQNNFYLSRKPVLYPSCITKQVFFLTRVRVVSVFPLSSAHDVFFFSIISLVFGKLYSLIVYIPCKQKIIFQDVLDFDL